MIYLILSDLHGNLEAMKALKNYLSKSTHVDGIILLGDIVDYGPHSNEVIAEIKKFDIPIICNIRGNHEDIILSGDYSRLSTDRGRRSSAYTKSKLTKESIAYIENNMGPKGFASFNLEGFKCFAIHGCLEDEYWGKFNHESDFNGYEEYDYVFMGHSHIPHYIEHFYDIENAVYRNKKKTIFINPGSLGQPRNHCTKAQFAILELPSGKLDFLKLDYDIVKEQRAFSENVDGFYRTRLEVGV